MRSFYMLVCAAALLSTALVTGLLYGYSCSVNQGLGRLPDATYLAAMQSINTAILNPAFFASFMGALVALPLCAWVLYRNGRRAWRFVLAAALIYAVGVFGVTMAGNVPLNNGLAAVDIARTDAAGLSLARASFEPLWNRYHAVRTGFAGLSLILIIMAFTGNRLR